MSIDMNLVPVLSRAQVEQRAKELLTEVEIQLKIELKPPIDVDLIADNHLGIQIIFDDLLKLYNDPSLHGGLYIPEKKMVVEEKLSPGRISFTIGHEVGHWILHRHLLKIDNPDQSLLFEFDDFSVTQPIHPMLCRTDDKAWGERQADWFSAALLMPAQYVKQAFDRNFSNPQVFRSTVLDSFKGGYHAEESYKTWDFPDECFQVLNVVNQVWETGNFTNVSKEALRVRLETLKLIIPESSQGMMSFQR